MRAQLLPEKAYPHPECFSSSEGKLLTLREKGPSIMQLPPGVWLAL